MYEQSIFVRRLIRVYRACPKRSVNKLGKSLSQLLANTAGKGFVKSLTCQRWIVFSEHTCKLFYFKEKGSTECLGEINIAGATFNYDPEDSDGLFTIMSGGEIHYFTARNDASRQVWLESLQEGKVRFINRCQ
ncbi:Pleckstrin domain, partial [Trinorchestia longiramus]